MQTHSHIALCYYYIASVVLFISTDRHLQNLMEAKREGEGFPTGSPKAARSVSGARRNRWGNMKHTSVAESLEQHDPFIFILPTILRT